MTMPVMEPDLDAAVLRDWARAIDDGPFASLCWGERMAFDNPETLTLMGALAAWTDRVRLVTTVIVPQLHDPVMLAKALATGDMLCGGRLTVGIGVGGRVEDYRGGRRGSGDADHAWHGRAGGGHETSVGGREDHRVGAAGRAGAGPGGWAAAAGRNHRAEDRAQRCGLGRRPGRTTLDLDVAKQNELFDVARAAWAEAGKPKPHLATSFWFALGSVDEARPQVHRHLRRYMNWIPAEYIDAMAPTTGFAGSEEELVAVLRKFEAVGTDEIQLIPTSSDLESTSTRGRRWSATM